MKVHSPFDSRIIRGLRHQDDQESRPDVTGSRKMDLYDDLIEERAADSAATVEENAQLKKQVAKLEEDKRMLSIINLDLSNKLKTCATNISSLMKTSRTEINRKNKTIETLRTELEDLLQKKTTLSKSQMTAVLDRVKDAYGDTRQLVTTADNVKVLYRQTDASCDHTITVGNTSFSIMQHRDNDAPVRHKKFSVKDPASFVESRNKRKRSTSPAGDHKRPRNELRKDESSRSLRRSPRESDRRERRPEDRTRDDRRSRSRRESSRDRGHHRSSAEDRRSRTDKKKEDPRLSSNSRTQRSGTAAKPKDLLLPKGLSQSETNRRQVSSSLEQNFSGKRSTPSPPKKANVPKMDRKPCEDPKKKNDQPCIGAKISSKNSDRKSSEKIPLARDVTRERTSSSQSSVSKNLDRPKSVTVRPTKETDKKVDEVPMKPKVCPVKSDLKSDLKSHQRVQEENKSANNITNRSGDSSSLTSDGTLETSTTSTSSSSSSATSSSSSGEKLPKPLEEPDKSEKKPEEKREKLIWKIDKSKIKHTSHGKNSYFGPQPPENYQDMDSIELESLIETTKDILTRLKRKEVGIKAKIVEVTKEDGECSSDEESSDKPLPAPEPVQHHDESAMDVQYPTAPDRTPATNVLVDDLCLSDATTDSCWGSHVGPFNPEVKKPAIKPRYSSGSGNTKAAGSKDYSSTEGIAEILRGQLLSDRGYVSPNTGIIRTPTEEAKKKRRTKDLFKELGLDDSNSCSNLSVKAERPTKSMEETLGLELSSSSEDEENVSKNEKENLKAMLKVRKKLGKSKPILTKK